MALILSTSRVTPATCVYTALHGCYGFRASSTSPVTTVISASKAPPSPSVSLSFNCDSQHHSLKLVNFRLLWVVKEEMYREVSVNGINIQRREKFRAFFFQNDHHPLEGCIIIALFHLIIIIITIHTTILTSQPGKLGALLVLQFLSSLDSTSPFGPRQFSWWALYALVQKKEISEVDPFNPPSNQYTYPCPGPKSWWCWYKV